jgi:hypothetical protein
MIPLHTPIFVVALENWYVNHAPSYGNTFGRGGAPSAVSAQLLKVAEHAAWISSYELDAHVPLLYVASVRALLEWRMPVPQVALGPRLAFTDRLPAIAAFVSNCGLNMMRPPRALFIRELSRGYPVHHYGRCNDPAIIGGSVGAEDSPTWVGDWARDEGGLETFAEDNSTAATSWGTQRGKLRLASRYRYVIAIENSIGFDYVTEKLYESFASGAVPIYLGAPNVRDFIPHADAIVHAVDFSSPHALADHLRHLDRDETAWLRYHAWRGRSVPKHFEDLQAVANLNTMPLTCRLCACVAGLMGCAREEVP